MASDALRGKGFGWVYGAASVVVFLAVSILVLPSDFAGSPNAPWLGVAAWVDRAMTWLVRDASVGGLALSDLTRALAAAAQAPIEAMQKVLAEGWVTGAGFNKTQILPPMSWLGLTLGCAFVAYRLAGPALAIFAVVSGLQ